jgi:acetylornithine deacetylase
MEMPGFLTAADDGLVTTAMQSVRDIGSAGFTDIWTASCDGGFVAQQMGIRTVVLGPGEIENQAHRPDESVAVQQLTDSAKAYALIATRIAAPPGL